MYVDCLATAETRSRHGTAAFGAGERRHDRSDPLQNRLSSKENAAFGCHDAEPGIYGKSPAERHAVRGRGFSQ